MILQKQTRYNTNRFDVEIVAIIDKLLEYKCITPTMPKKTTNTFNLQ